MMRREITGILLFFLVILTLISLLSYSPADPSINNARAAGHIHNFFGIFGAHLADILIGLFGLGAFWIPILLLLTSIHIFGGHPGKAIILTLIGGIILMITTGSLLALKHNHIIIFGSKFSSGGIIGIPLKSFLIKYSNVVGGTII
ncbi:MAG: DNA translocase FtsK 4TM domain-containing protein, partial [Desulfobacteraceae bacterium]|nr:DNA translocase FtsK 4TM domain-containing protein [Desulfobacteraceae bacterium]